MPETSTITLKSLGLNTDPSELSAPQGSLAVANNVIIRRENITEPRRGFKDYGTAFGSESDRAKQLFEYRNRILRHYGTVLQFDTEVLNLNQESIFESFSGVVTEVQPGLRIKGIEANGNFYFTTYDGIKKLSAPNASDFPNTPITNAGGIKAFNINTRLSITNGSSAGFLPEDSAVAYRVVWGIKDANNNLVLGTPSERSIIYNPLQQTVIRDLMQVLAALDALDTTGSKITDGNYVSTLKLNITASADDIRTNLIALSKKIDQDQGNILSTGQISSASVTSTVCTVTISDNVGLYGRMQPGDKVYLDGTWTAFDGTDLSGVRVVKSIASMSAVTTFAFDAPAADGALTLIGETVEFGWFRAITQPGIPSVPATHDQIQALHTYLDNIIGELQSGHNLKQVSKNSGVSTAFPSEITSASVSSGTTLTVNFDAASDERDIFIPADLIVLNGTWNSASPTTSLAGLQTIATVSSLSISCTIPSTTNGAVTLDTTSTIQTVLRFTDALQATYVNSLQITTSANVFVDINIPTAATTSSFYQIYRSDITTASTTDVLADLIPSDEMRQVFEDFPTQTQIDAGTLTVEDIVPETFFEGGAFLYTNPDSGEGILQANDVPPKATDVNRFKNYTFYSNTSTRQHKQINLLGVTGILADYNNGLNPSFTVSSGTTSDYRFVKGIQQITSIVCGAFVNITPSGYFTISTGNNITNYYVWFDTTGSDVDPAPAGKIGIKVLVVGLSTAASISQRLSDILSIYVDSFSNNVNTSTATVTVTNSNEGPCTNAAIVTGLASPFAITTTTSGQGEKTTTEITQFNVVAGNLYVTSGTADYVTLNTPYDRQLYYFWFQVTGGSAIDPALNDRVGFPIVITNADSANTVALKMQQTITTNVGSHFTASNVGNAVTTTTKLLGPTVAATEVVGDAGFTLTLVQRGALDILLSNLVSRALSVQETAKSLIDVVNKDKSHTIAAFYLSGINDVPGIIEFEAEDLATPAFYVLTNRAATGASFSPSLAPSSIGITNIAANPTVVTFTNHGLLDGDQIFISGSNSFPLINGVYSIKKIDANTFSIPIEVLTGGTSGAFIKIANDTDITSDNEVRVNRIYYSKLQQPEAVPILNYLDVGATDKEILRIFPFRDSLFIFKQDGIYRLSGEIAPFTVALFGPSINLICPDSVAVANDLIFAYTNDGISRITENGIQKVSKPIDNLILPLNTPQYAGFKTASWAVGYNSDNSYLFFTVTQLEDTVATITYRYSTLTNNGFWTTYDKTNICGIVKSSQDLLYLGNGDSNNLQQERKTFTRTDYADKELDRTLVNGNYLADGVSMIMSGITDIAQGDVIYQEQLISNYDYNALLKKLDIDTGVAPLYVVTNATWSGTQATFTLSAAVNSFLAVGDSVIVENMNPIGFNGTYVITSIPTSTTLTVVLLSNPGTFISGGTLAFRYFDTFRQTFGRSMRTALVTLTAKLDIDPGINDSDYSTAIADLSGVAVPVSATNPTVATKTNHGLLTNRYIGIPTSTAVPSPVGNFHVIKLNANTFSIPVNVLTAGTIQYETLINDFNDIQACYNIIIDKLNLDTGVSFSNYKQVTDTKTYECVIDDSNIFNGRITLNKAFLPFIVGPLKIFKSFECDITFLPTTLQNHLFLKQFSEAQYFFLNKTFTRGQLQFSSDLVPATTNITVNGFGNGIFGNEQFGENYFGGDSHGAPFRTYVPKANQKARFLNIGFSHNVAREKFSLLGVTITGRLVSTRAYR